MRMQSLDYPGSISLTAFKSGFAFSQAFAIIRGALLRFSLDILPKAFPTISTCFSGVACQTSMLKSMNAGAGFTGARMSRGGARVLLLGFMIFWRSYIFSSNTTSVGLRLSKKAAYCRSYPWRAFFACPYISYIVSTLNT